MTRPLTIASPADFRGLMANFPTGVSIVTTFDDGVPRGMTCSSICGVAVAPPTLIVCLRAGSPTLAALLSSGTFAVNLLHEAARDRAELFASGAPDRFSRVRWESGPDDGGPYLVDDAHVIGDCRVRHSTTIGDHVVVFGEVRRVLGEPGPHRPLLYGRRGYAVWPVPPC